MHDLTDDAATIDNTGFDQVAMLEGAVADLDAQLVELSKRLDQDNPPGPQFAEVARPVLEFDDTVASIRSRDSCSRVQAMAKARRENPEGFAAYAHGPIGEDFATLVEKEIRKGCAPNVAAQRVALQHPAVATEIGKGVSVAMTDFALAVDRTVIEKKLSRTAAMSEVRKR